MDMIDFSKNALWSILPETFDEMLRRVGEYKLERPNAAEIEGALRRFGADPAEKLYQVSADGIAEIEVAGPLAKRLGFWSIFFGGASYEIIQAAYRQALADDSVAGILLRLDSPGGTLSGLEEVAELVFNSRKKKPCAALAEGVMASAAYWLGSAAGRVFAQKTSIVGSIGVLIVHTDWSQWEKNAGIKTTYLTAGKYKAIGNPSEPLSEFARKEIQEKLDTFYKVFTDTVALHRDAELSDVLSRMADGKTFIGEQAMGVGLVDEIGDRAAALSWLKDQISAGGKTSTIHLTEGASEMKIDLEMLEKENPELLAQIRQAAKAEGQKQGTDGERARVTEILAADGDAGVAKKAIADGTPAADTFKLFFAAEKKMRADNLAALKGSATPSQGVEEPDTKKAETKPAHVQLAEKAAVMAREKGISLEEAQKTVFRENPELARAWAPVAPQ